MAFICEEFSIFKKQKKPHLIHEFEFRIDKQLDKKNPPHCLKHMLNNYAHSLECFSCLKFPEAQGLWYKRTLKCWVLKIGVIT
jgi:hypothetical protein